MKLAAFSDVHGNQYAFARMMEMLRQRCYAAVFFCGDIHGYYYGQTQIIRQLQTIPNLYAVRGNHDEMAVRLSDGQLSGEGLIAKYGHSYQMLQAGNIQYVRQLPCFLHIKIEGKSFAVVHGTLENPLEGRLYPEDSIRDIQAYAPYDYVFCGHTHVQMIRRCQKTMILNAGSVGQQRDGKGACFLEFDTDTQTGVYQRITYDKKPLIEEIRKHDSANLKLSEILYRGET